MRNAIVFILIISASCLQMRKHTGDTIAPSQIRIVNIGPSRIGGRVLVVLDKGADQVIREDLLNVFEDEVLIGRIVVWNVLKDKSVGIAVWDDLNKRLREESVDWQQIVCLASEKISYVQLAEDYVDFRIHGVKYKEGGASLGRIITPVDGMWWSLGYFVDLPDSGISLEGSDIKGNVLSVHREPLLGTLQIALIDIGRKSGLGKGSRLSAWREGQLVAKLTVNYVTDDTSILKDGVRGMGVGSWKGRWGRGYGQEQTFPLSCCRS